MELLGPAAWGFVEIAWSGVVEDRGVYRRTNAVGACRRASGFLVWGNSIFAGRPGLRPRSLPQGDIDTLEKETSSLGLQVKKGICPHAIWDWERACFDFSIHLHLSLFGQHHS